MNTELLTLAPVAWLLRGGLFFAGTVLIGLLLRRQSAAWQAFFWRSALLASLALTAVSLVPWRPFVLRRATAQWRTTAVVHAMVIPEPERTTAARGLANLEPSRVVIGRRASFDGTGTTAIWSVWGCGATVVILRWLSALRQRRRFMREAREVRDLDWLAVLSTVTAPSKPPRLFRHPTTVVPCAWGMSRPTVVVPACADHWTMERRQMALQHEWSHLQRRDPAWQILGVLVLALHWANPLVWLALRRWRLTEEQVADDAVLNHPYASDRYALLLVECARSLASGGRTAPASSSMAYPSTVPVRIGRILDASQDRRRPGWLRCTLSVAGLVACLLVTLHLTPTLAAQANGNAPKPAEKVPRGGEAEAVPKRLYASTAESTAAAEVVNNFLLADGVEAKLRYVRFSEKVAPLMRKWYATHPSGPVQSARDDVATSLTKLIHIDDMKFIVVTLQLLPDLNYRFYAVESTPQGLNLDWETAVGWQVMTVDEFRKARPTSPQPFRVHVGAGDYYNGPYADEKKWLCCALTHPGDDSFRFFGYVDRSTAAGRILAKHFADDESISAILAIGYGQESSEPNQVTIHSILSEEWFLKGGPAIIDPSKGQ